MSSSATGGYISPSGVVLYDQQLEDIFQAFIVGVSGLPSDMVRPRWQKVPPPMPDVGVDWVAFAVKVVKPENSPAFMQDTDSTTAIRHEELDLFFSFYGNNGQSFANILKDGLAIPQNIAQLRTQKIKYVECGEITSAPDFLNNQYVHRYDLVATFRRQTERTYEVLTFTSASSINIHT